MFVLVGAFQLDLLPVGDFDAWRIGTRTYHVGAIQGWLERVLGVPKPSTVDSAAIAGMVDLLRTQGQGWRGDHTHSGTGVN